MRICETFESHDLAFCRLLLNSSSTRPTSCFPGCAARPVNPADLFSIAGVYPGFAPQAFPATPGLEGAGIVEDNNGSKLVANGQRVVVFVDAKNGNGSWQEYVAVSEQAVLAVPDSISDASAAQFVVNPLTVVGMLEVLAAPAGAYVLQTAAASTLGRQFIALAKLRGLKTINIVRRAEQIAELQALGADVVLNSEQAGIDLAAEVKAATGGAMAHGAIDAVGGALTGTLTDCVRFGGTIYIYGALSGVSYAGSVRGEMCVCERNR